MPSTGFQLPRSTSKGKRPRCGPGDAKFMIKVKRASRRRAGRRDCKGAATSNALLDMRSSGAQTAPEGRPSGAKALLGWRRNKARAVRQVLCEAMHMEPGRNVKWCSCASVYAAATAHGCASDRPCRLQRWRPHQSKTMRGRHTHNWTHPMLASIPIAPFARLCPPTSRR